jgi:hypothetical protein
MMKNKVFQWGLGVASLILIANVVYRLVFGLAIGEFEIMTTGPVLIWFLFTVTWQSPYKKEGISRKEELGQTIETKSEQGSYTILMGVVLVGLLMDWMITGSTNTALIIILLIGMLLPEILNYIIVQTYEIEPNVIGRMAKEIQYRYSKISRKQKRRAGFFLGFLVVMFMPRPEGETRSFYDVLVFLFGEPSESGNHVLPLLFSVAVISLVCYLTHKFIKDYDES